MSGMQRTSSLPLNVLLAGLVLAAGLVEFGLRLIPLPEGDRAIYEAVADGLRAGQRLYEEVHDYKDLVFFYALALQRLAGPWGGGIFELDSLALGGWGAGAWLSCIAG